MITFFNFIEKSPLNTNDMTEDPGCLIALKYPEEVEVLGKEIPACDGPWINAASLLSSSFSESPGS